MPMQRERYPADWEAISLRIRQRDGWKCQKCGVANDARIVRSRVDPARYIVYDEKYDGYRTPEGLPIRMSEIPDEFDTSDWSTHKRVILTVHHIGAPRDDGSPGDVHDKMDCRDINLTSLCQRCHFIADLPSHVVSARKARAEKRKQRILATGQLEMELL